MVEEFKQNAVLHGINPDDTDKGMPNTFDTRNINGDDWQKTAEWFNSQQNYGRKWNG